MGLRVSSFLALALLLAVSMHSLAGETVENFIFFEFHQQFRRDYLKQLENEPALKTSAKSVLLENCRAFSRKRTKARYADEPELVNFGQNSCYAHLLLINAMPHGGYRPESYATELIHRLDYKSFLNSFRQRMDAASQHTLADLPGNKYGALGRYGAYLDTEYWSEGVCVIADADLNGNGKPDWLIVLSEASKTGTLRSNDVLVAFDVEPTGLIKAESLVPPE